MKIFEDEQFKDTLLVVDYKKIFSDTDYAASIFKWLGLDMNDNVLKTLSEFINRSKQISNKRSEVHPHIMHYINEHVDWDLSEAVLNKAS